MVNIHIAALQRDPSVWAHPDEFDPTRFLDESQC
jgi:cytochrome P450